MRKYGLIGKLLGHSFSQQYFNKKFISEAIIDCRYDNYELENPDIIRELIHNNPDICGLNVTIPYKTEIISYLDDVDNEATKVGAVNVIKVTKRYGKIFLKGFNTDIFGFEESLKPLLSGRKIDNAIILGTGGSSKAIKYVLEKPGIKLIFVSRKKDLNRITYEDLDCKLISSNKLIINTTPLGMFPDLDSKPEIDYNCLTATHILYDLIYNPEITAFLKEGKERGCQIKNGLEMLHLQAEKSWEIWNNENY